MSATIAPLGRLLEPVTLAGLPLSSHFAMAPMTRKRSPGGVPTAEVAAYYRRRAAGGVGLIITEGILVDHPSAGHESTVPVLTPGAASAGWHAVTTAVHAAGGKIAAQLWHLGSSFEPAPAAWTPSTMKGADFADIIAAYARSARAAVNAGFDAVEIHAAHGYLLDEFLWPLTNPRSLADRVAFPAEVVCAVRAELPSAMPLIVRFSQFKERDYTARIAETPSDLGAVLSTLAGAGANVLHASQRRFDEPAFPETGLPDNVAGWAKRLTGLPTITVGSVGLNRAFLTRPAPAGTGRAALGGGAACGDAACGDAACGDAACGDAACGDTACGDAACGDTACGDTAGGDVAGGDVAGGDTAGGGLLSRRAADNGGAGGLDRLLERHARGEFDVVALGRVLLANPDWVRLAAAGRVDAIRDYRKADEDVYC
jgi:2,4-dienoyl-CoA reductase-like NADH-dependent reductase (Old Yellow Enzyme family)